MLSLVILFILFIGAYSGYQNGLITGLIRTIGYTLSLILALTYYEQLSELIYLIVPYPSPFSPIENPYHYYEMDMIFTLDQSYYYLVSLLVILIIGWLITRFISQFLSYFAEEMFVPEPFDGMGGSIIGFVVNYSAVFLILFILSTIPYDAVQNRLADSALADNMLTSTPILSKKTEEQFILDVHDEEMNKLPTMELEELREKEAPEEANESEE